MMCKDLMTIGGEKLGTARQTAVNQAVKDLNKISGVTPTKKVKTEKEKTGWCRFELQ